MYPRPLAPLAPSVPRTSFGACLAFILFGENIIVCESGTIHSSTQVLSMDQHHHTESAMVTCPMGVDAPMDTIPAHIGRKEQPSHNSRPLMLLMQTSQCLQFKSLVECLKELLSEVNMDFIEGKGTRLVSIDPGRVAMIHLVVNNIESFYTKGTVTAGINVVVLYKMIRSMTSNDFMEWRIYEDEPHRMEIELSNSERRTKTVNSIKLLDLEAEDIIIPQVEFDRVVSMPSSELSKHVREMVTVSPFMTIRATRTTLELVSEGEMARSHVTIEPTASGLNWKHSEKGDGH